MKGRLLKKLAIDTVFYTVLMPVYTTGKWGQKKTVSGRKIKEVMQDDKDR